MYMYMYIYILPTVHENMNNYYLQVHQLPGLTLFLMPYTILYWRWQYRVKAKQQCVVWPSLHDISNTNANSVCWLKKNYGVGGEP